MHPTLSFYSVQCQTTLLVKLDVNGIKSINKIFNLWHISLLILKGDDINTEETPLPKAKR
jgi:hypothetical protein